MQIWWCRTPGGVVRWRRRRELLRTVRALLRELDLPSPLDVTSLAYRLGEARGKPIVVNPTEMPVDAASGESTGGVWLSSRAVDMIFVEQHTSPIHQAHIVLHEIGHIVANHPDQGGRDTLRTLLSEIPDDLIDRVLHRGHGYDDAAEAEAELVATTVATWADLVGQQEVQLSTTDHQTPLGRIRQAFYERRGWQ